MTYGEKRILDGLPTVAYWSELGGVEVKDAVHGMDTHLCVVMGTFAGHRSYHRVKILYRNDKAYIKLHGHLLYLDNCIRIT